MSDLVERLLEAIAEAEEAAEQYPEDHSDPDGVLRLCQAHREIIKAWPDVMGQWSAEEAEAAVKMKQVVIRKLAGGYGIQEESNDGQ